MWAYNLSRSFHVTEIYSLKTKEPSCNLQFLQNAMWIHCPSHSALISIQIPTHDLLLDSANIESNKMNLIITF